MDFWNYIENGKFSEWCNTVIAGLLQDKGSVSGHINALMELYGNTCPQGNCAVLYHEKVSVSPSPNIDLYICYRDINQITLERRLNIFASGQTGTAKHLFIFEPTASLITQGMTDILVYSVENMQLQRL